MPAIPEGAKELSGYEPYGVDDNGNYVFFGLKSGVQERDVFHCNYLMLGKTIMYLQAVAKESQQRRIKVNPTAEHTEVRETQSNPVRQVDFEVDVTGQSVSLLCTTQDGLRTELQMPLDLIEGMIANAPSLVEQAKKLQAAHLERH